MNMLRTLIAALALSLALPAWAGHTAAGEPSSVQLDVLSGRRVALALTEPRGEATVRLFNSDGKLLYQETVSEAGQAYRKVLNLQQLTPGVYELLVELPGKQYRQALQITRRGELLARAEDREVHRLPTLRVGTSFVDLNWAGEPMSTLQVQVKRANGDLVYEEELEDVARVNRRYNLEQLEQGRYLVVVRTPYDTQYRRLTLD